MNINPFLDVYQVIENMITYWSKRDKIIFKHDKRKIIKCYKNGKILDYDQWMINAYQLPVVSVLL